jgi:hypothetical protein
MCCARAPQKWRQYRHRRLRVPSALKSHSPRRADVCGKLCIQFARTLGESDAKVSAALQVRRSRGGERRKQRDQSKREQGERDDRQHFDPCRQSPEAVR